MQNQKMSGGQIIVIVLAVCLIGWGLFMIFFK